jgi:transposase-like protein
MAADMNLIDLMEQYHSDEKCLQALESLRWPRGVRCPRCESDKVWRTERAQFDCGTCSYRFSVTSGTIFHDTHLPLRKWFLATYLMVESKKGMSAAQLSRTLKVTYKTAWYLCHRIRAAMRDAYPFPLRGIVEVDETYVGGSVQGKGKGYVGNKAIVVGAVQRGGKIVLQVIPDSKKKTLQGLVKEVAVDAHTVYIDEHASYVGLSKVFRHEAVHHKSEEYVRGDVHTNSVENVWSLLERSIMGAFHKVSLKHLDAYLDELEWRFNNRDNPYLFRDTLTKLLSSDTLEYKSLIA